MSFFLFPRSVIFKAKLEQKVFFGVMFHFKDPRRVLPKHCGSLVQPVLCALFLSLGFCLFSVTKFLSRGTLQKYLRGSLPSKVPSGVPFGYFITGGQCPSFQSPSKHPSPPTLLKCHIMCPRFSSELPSFESTS